MTPRELYDKLLSAKRAYDFFGEAASAEELHKSFRNYSKIVHPDMVQTFDSYISSEAFHILSRLYKEGCKELEEGIYGIVDPVKLYQKKEPLFTIKIKGKPCDFYENIIEGEVAYIFCGIKDGELVYMKLAIDEGDNGLLENEFDILDKNKHQLLPYVEAKIKVNGCNALLMREVPGEPLEELMKQYPKGIPPQHVMWMLERLFNVVGWLHYNNIIHGNIKPDNIMVDKASHKVTPLGLSFAVKDANLETSHYQVVNEYFTAPEVNKDARISPGSDIYSIGKVAVMMLGGNVKNNGMPLSIDVRVRNFIRKLCEPNPDRRPSDAWKLWDELISLRTSVYGADRFQTLT